MSVNVNPINSNEQRTDSTQDKGYPLVSSNGRQSPRQRTENRLNDRLNDLTARRENPFSSRDRQSPPLRTINMDAPQDTPKEYKTTLDSKTGQPITLQHLTYA